MNAVMARSVLLATGGLGQVYSETVSPAASTADGLAIAYRAGAQLRDVEFVQFIPAVLCLKGAPRVPLPERLRGEGAVFRNSILNRLMPRYHPEGESAPAGVVCRAITSEMQRTRSDFVFLDATHLSPDAFRKRLPDIYETCLGMNIDLSVDPVPIRPAANGSAGGVATDLEGRTTVAGLYAAGEVACTGMHGAVRLPSHGLLEALVLATRAAQAMTSEQEKPPQHAPEPDCLSLPGVSVQERQALRSMIWQHAGIVRSKKGLQGLLDAVHARESAPPDAARSAEALEFRNFLVAATAIAGSALAREESRGAHYREDFPYQVDKFSKHSCLAAGGKVIFR